MPTGGWGFVLNAFFLIELVFTFGEVDSNREWAEKCVAALAPGVVPAWDFDTSKRGLFALKKQRAP